MKNRILNNWSFIRVMYVLMGGFVIFQSYLQMQWFGILFGLYFASMGIFGYGCASGNCAINAPTKKENLIKDVEFEEIK